MPDLIYLDLVLPEKSGFEVLTAVKRDSKTKAIPVVVFLNLDSADDRRRAFKLGAAEYLVKVNVTLDQAVKEIYSLLEK